MAVDGIANELFQLVESVGSCFICKSLYQNPRVLPDCSHTFCLTCICDKAKSGEDSESAISLQCPRCNLQSSVTNNKQIETLKKNYFAHALLEIVTHIQTIDRGNVSNGNLYDFVRRLRDVTECPVCHEPFNEPRMLPCVHSFCCSCLKNSCSGSFWNPTTCPLCRQRFIIPMSGFTSLPTNDVLDRILDKLSEPEVQKLLSVVVDPENVPGDQREVIGVTELGGYVYVLMGQTNRIRVYLSQKPYAEVAAVSLTSGIIGSDLTSSSSDRCLFVTDLAEKGRVWCVHMEVTEVNFAFPSAIQRVVFNAPSTVSGDRPQAAESLRSEAVNETVVGVTDVENAAISSTEAVASVTSEEPDQIAASSSTSSRNTVENADDDETKRLREFIQSVVNGSEESATIPHSMITENSAAVSILLQAMMKKSGRSPFGGGLRQAVIEHKVELWLEETKAIGASVSDERQLLLVTESGELVLYSIGDKQLVAQYSLPDDVQKARHAVITKSGNFIVSHSAVDGSMHKVTELEVDTTDQKLRAIRSYGGVQIPPPGPLCWPRHLVLDERGYVFVADCGNDRVLLLDEKLNVNRLLLSRKEQLERPWRLALIWRLGLLIVGSVTGSVQIYSIAKRRDTKR